MVRILYPTTSSTSLHGPRISVSCLIKYRLALFLFPATLFLSTVIRLILSNSLVALITVLFEQCASSAMVVSEGKQETFPLKVWAASTTYNTIPTLLMRFSKIRAVGTLIKPHVFQREEEFLVYWAKSFDWFNSIGIVLAEILARLHFHSLSNGKPEHIQDIENHFCFFLTHASSEPFLVYLSSAKETLF